MALKHYLVRFFQLPLGEALNRAVGVLARAFTRFLRLLQARFVPTYTVRGGGDVLARRIFCPPDFAATLAENPGHRIREICDHLSPWLTHENISYALRARGRNVNLANRKRSEEALKTLSPDYVRVDWQRDPVSGYLWNNRCWHSSIRYGNRYGVDIKLPWEFARGHHLVELAALATDETRDLCWRAFRDEVTDFYANNPPGFGVQWACTMDVGIRVANWLLAQDLFKSQGCIDETFDALLTDSIWDHGQFIADNLEWNKDLRGNHYFANICGLLFTALYLPENEKTNSWLKFGTSQLIGELSLQFNPDCSNFESSTAYHALVLEMAVYTCALLWGTDHARLVRAGKTDAKAWVGYPGTRANTETWPPEGELPAWLGEKLMGAVQFMAASAFADGTPFLIGDNDSGRFVRIGTTPFDPLTQAREFENYLQERTKSSFVSTLLAQLGAPRGVQMLLHNGKQHSFPDFGLYRFCGNGYSVWVRCGDVGQNGFGGHAHNDQLSVLAEFDGLAFFIDPGTATYTRDQSLRNRNRSTAYHNTLFVSGVEQNGWHSGAMGLFNLTDPGNWEVEQVSPARFGGRVARQSMHHSRQIRCEERGFAIHDWSSGCATASLFLHPAVDVKLEGGTFWLVRQDVVVIGFFIGASEVNIETTEWSPRYGVVQATRVIRVRTSGNLVTEINLGERATPSAIGTS